MAAMVSSSLLLTPPQSLPHHITVSASLYGAAKATNRIAQEVLTSLHMMQI